MISDAWMEEAQHLMQLPRTFDAFVEYPKRVSPTCLIDLDRNRYSVPASFANRPVSVRVYPERIVVAGEGQVICEHRRVFARSHQRKSTTTVFDCRHYLAVIQRKPGALRNGAPFAELPPAFRALQQRMLKTPGGDREMVEILALVLQHDEQAVLTAVELLLEAGAPTKTHILNLLHRLIDGKPAPTPFRAAAWSAIDASIAPATAEPAKRSSNSPGFGFATNQRAGDRVGSPQGRIRRVTIVALARKLWIAIWRFVTLGLAPEGAIIAAQNSVTDRSAADSRRSRPSSSLGASVPCFRWVASVLPRSRA
jgi:hypothetical protein